MPIRESGHRPSGSERHERLRVELYHGWTVQRDTDRSWHQQHGTT
jgi:hypothetical protein